MSQEPTLSYEDVVARVNGDEFFSLFESLKAEPRWVNSNNKPAIQLVGLCHGGSHHSALFDPTTFKIHCFSACGCGMYLHTWVGKVTEEYNPDNVKNHLIHYFVTGVQDLVAREPQEGVELGYTERPFVRENIEMVPGIPSEMIEEIRAEQGWKNDLQTLSETTWHTEDGIDAEILQEFDVAWRPPVNAHKEVYEGRTVTKCDRFSTIILPHHNKKGEIVGLYERSFDLIRREAKKKYPDFDYAQLATFPRAKYVPLLKISAHMEEGGKTSYSFPNSSNLYGLHKAADAIAKTGKAIIFEGAKSVMLAHQWSREFGVPEWATAVASHTFGAHVNHINMLIECGAKEIYLAFDKQYKVEEGEEWVLYDKKSRELAEKVHKWTIENPDLPEAQIRFFRLRDSLGELDYKEAPVDRGVEAFMRIWENPEELTGENAVPEKVIGKEIPVSEETQKTINDTKKENRVKLIHKVNEKRGNKYYITQDGEDTLAAGLGINF